MGAMMSACLWLVRLLVIYPGLPDSWTLTPLLQQAQIDGLQMNVWQLDISDDTAYRWRNSHRPRCTLISPPQATDWHCLDENRLYSLIASGDAFIWVQSERRSDLARPQLPFRTELLSQYHQGDDEVSLLQTRLPLYSVQAQLLRQQRDSHSLLLMHEQHEQGFVMQWQRAGTRFSLTAQRDSGGLVQLVYVKGAR